MGQIMFVAGASLGSVGNSAEPLASPPGCWDHTASPHPRRGATMNVSRHYNAQQPRAWQDLGQWNKTIRLDSVLMAGHTMSRSSVVNMV